MDIFKKADMIREALPNREGVVVSGDARIVFDTFRQNDTEFLAVDCPEDPRRVLAYILAQAYLEGHTAGEEDQKAAMRVRLGL